MMDATNRAIAELEKLLWQMRTMSSPPMAWTRIESLVTGDAEVRRFYIRYSTLCGGLRWLNAGTRKQQGSESVNSGFECELTIDDYQSAGVAVEMPPQFNELSLKHSSFGIVGASPASARTPSPPPPRSSPPPSTIPSAISPMACRWRTCWRQ